MESGGCVQGDSDMIITPATVGDLPRNLNSKPCDSRMLNPKTPEANDGVAHEVTKPGDSIESPIEYTSLGCCSPFEFMAVKRRIECSEQVPG